MPPAELPVEVYQPLFDEETLGYLNDFAHWENQWFNTELSQHVEPDGRVRMRLDLICTFRRIGMVVDHVEAVAYTAEDAIRGLWESLQEIEASKEMFERGRAN